MFGYIQIFQNEMKIKHMKLYRNFYCALCTELGKEFGLFYRLFNSYDATFFTILFDAIIPQKQMYFIKCPFRFKKNCIYISNISVKYGSLINYYWIINKINDDYNDNKHFIYKLRKIIFYKSSKNKRALKKYKEFFEELDINLNKFIEFEKDSNMTFDDLTNMMVELFAKAFTMFINFSKAEININLFCELGFNLGKWIYIMDAYDDYLEDIKHGNFNPIYKLSDYEQIKNDKSKIKNKMNMIGTIIINKIYKCFLRLELTKNDQYFIIENIILYGMNDTINKIEGKYDRNDY